jgi:hypothetical protein
MSGSFFRSAATLKIFEVSRASSKLKSGKMPGSILRQHG